MGRISEDEVDTSRRYIVNPIRAARLPQVLATIAGESIINTNIILHNCIE